MTKVIEALDWGVIGGSGVRWADVILLYMVGRNMDLPEDIKGWNLSPVAIGVINAYNQLDIVRRREWIDSAYGTIAGDIKDRCSRGDNKSLAEVHRELAEANSKLTVLMFKQNPLHWQDLEV